MDKFESYLQYQREITETKLKIINRFQKAVQPKPIKRTSKIEIAKNVLRIAGRPLHVSEIIQLAQRDFQVTLDRDSIVSAILKKVNAGKSFIRTAPNTFALKEHHKGGAMISEISRILLKFRGCFSRQAAFDWFVIVIFGFIVRIDHYGVSSFVRWLGIKPSAVYVAAFIFQGIVLAIERYHAKLVADCFVPLPAD